MEHKGVEFDIDIVSDNFGKSKYVTLDDNHIFITFEDGNTREFVYPDAFLVGFLKTDDKGINYLVTQYQTELQARVKQFEEQKKKEAEEYEKIKEWAKKYKIKERKYPPEYYDAIDSMKEDFILFPFGGPLLPETSDYPDNILEIRYTDWIKYEN